MSQRRLAGGVSAVVLVLLVTVVPLVPYSVSFAPSLSSLSGRSTILYRLTGVGGPPFPSVALASTSNETALVHFAGTKITYWEGPLPAGTVLNPSGYVKVTNVTMTQWIYGLLNFSAVVTNVGGTPISDVRVLFGYPTYGTNETSGGLTRYTAPSAPCSPSLPPGSSCRAVASLPQSQKLLTGQQYPLFLEVVSPGSTSGGAAPSFVYVVQTHLRYQGAALSPQWVLAFIQAVNQKRNATALTENKTLDEFAAFRYNSIRARYQISDYNFTEDYARFFGQSNYSAFEEILYPQDQSPATFPDVLHDVAPGHWAGLMDPTFTKFGYFFGVGPSVVIGPGCPAKEVPGPNINITQFVISQGCDYVVADQVWLILILGA